MVFNPAGIGRLDGFQFSGSASGMFSQIDFDNGNGQLSTFGLPIPGDGGGDAGKNSFGAGLLRHGRADRPPAHWPALGGSYAFTKSLSADLGYAVDIVALQLNLKF